MPPSRLHYLLATAVRKTLPLETYPVMAPRADRQPLWSGLSWVVNTTAGRLDRRVRRYYFVAGLRDPIAGAQICTTPVPGSEFSDAHVFVGGKGLGIACTP